MRRLFWLAMGVTIGVLVLTHDVSFPFLPRCFFPALALPFTGGGAGSAHMMRAS